MAQSSSPLEGVIKLPLDLGNWLTSLDNSESKELLAYFEDHLKEDQTIFHLRDLLKKYGIESKEKECEHIQLTGKRRWELLLSFFKHRGIQVNKDGFSLTWDYKEFQKESLYTSLNEFRKSWVRRVLQIFHGKWVSSNVCFLPFHQQTLIKILLIGTHPILRDVLQQFSYSFHEVSNGVLALEKIKREVYTHIFIQHPLPVLSGKELEKKIQEICQAKTFFIGQTHEFPNMITKIHPDQILKILH